MAIGPIKIELGPQNARFNMDGFEGAGLYSDLNLEGGSGSYRWEDGDTVYDEYEQGYRILGMNAYETEHIGLDKQAYKAGQAGGEIQKQQFYHLANELGYNNLVKTGKKDDYNRYIVDLQDASGQSFATSLYSNGILKPNYWTSEKDRRAYESRHFNTIMGVDTTTSEWGKAKATIDTHMNNSRMVNINDGSMVIKKRALNEWQLSAAKDEASRYGVYSSPYMDRAVQYKHEGMDIDGNATNVFASGVSQGWASMKEATSGALSLLGSLTNNEDWYQQGMLSADVQASQMERMPKFVQNIDDVTFGENAAEYVMGLGGVSIPWMLGIIGGGALGTLAVGASATGLAAVAGVGIGITPIAVAYAGEIFNNMEGDINTKNPKVAIVGGITMSILDRLGLKGIMKPSQVLKKDGMKQLKDQYIKKEMDILEASPKFAKLNASQQQVARQGVISRVAKDIKDAKIGGVRDFVSAMAGHADIQIKKRLILKEFGHGVVKGGLWETATETAQESTSYLASVYGSEKEFNLKEFRQIAKNAAAGGFVMGSTIGGTMNTASGLGSIRKMQSDYGTTGTSAEDGFFNFTTNDKGQVTGRAVDKDGNFIDGANITEDQFNNIQNPKESSNASVKRQAKYKDTTWEPQFIEVEDIHNEMINDYGKFPGGESTIQKDVDNEVKLGEGKGVVGEDGTTEGKLTLWDKAKRLPRQAFQKYGSIVASQNLNNPDLDSKAKKYISALLQTFAPTNMGLAAGVGFQKIKGRLIQGYTTEAEQLRTALLNTVNKSNTRRGREAAVKEFKKFIDSKKAMADPKNPWTYADHKRQFGETTGRLQAIHERMTNLTDLLRNTVNSNTDSDVGRIEDWFLNSAKLDSALILKGKGRFITALQKDWTHPDTGVVHHGISKKHAESLYHRLIFDAQGQHEVLQDNVYNTTTAASAANKVTLNVNANPNMQEFLHTDHFGKLENNIHDMINYSMDMKYLGKDDIKLNKMIMMTKRAMGDKWDPNIAAVVKNSVDTQRGRYKAMKSKALKKAQDNITFFNTLTQLDTSMLASLPEIALVTLSATYNKGLINVVRQGAADVIKHYGGTIKSGKQRLKGASMTDPDLKDVMPTPRILDRYSGDPELVHDYERELPGIDRSKRYDVSIEEINMNRISFYGGQYGTSHHGVLGAVDIDSSAYATSKWKQYILESFFRLNGLKFLTDGARVARLAIANDAIFNDLEIVIGFYQQGKLNSNYANDAYERLRELNIDPLKAANQFKKVNNELKGLFKGGSDVFKPIAADKDLDFAKFDTEKLHEYIFKNHPELYNTLEDARISFVDNALARPTSIDRPLWYSNPHFRLLTQYQGFLSTFTSHIIPKLYKRAKKMDPTIKYQAFAVAASMLALALMGQEMKDQWKFGTHSPYIDTNLKTAQRAVSASGLLGTGHRILDFVHPIYTSSPRYNETAIDQMGRFFSHSLDEFGGPTGGTIKNARRIASNLIEGKTATALYYGKNWVPLIGRHMKGDKPHEIIF
tara:strand:- start:2994 stop:7508 length:4515 start_codon:yes stop_codon:yes gene_type:complete